MEVNQIQFKLFEVLDTFQECINYLWDIQLGKGAKVLIDDLLLGANSIKNSLEILGSTDEIKHNFAKELNLNLENSLKELKKYLEEDKIDDGILLMRCEVFPIFDMLYTEVDYFYNLLLDEKQLEKYYELENKKLRDLFNEEKRDIEDEFPFEVSIVILLYNNMEMTKLCIDSVLKYTKNIKYELITVNNGSNQETTKWIESLSHTKKITLKHNIGSSRGGTIALLSYFIDGKYVAYLSNDVVVTENWLENLLKCIKSDNKIAYVSPVYNSASNLQSIPVTYKDMKEMQLFAKNYNISDSKKWEQRARLFGIAMLYKPWVFDKIGKLVDLHFTNDMFADDDFSVRVKRAGYKMISCKDTFIHHFGSSTIGDSQFEVMGKARTQFYNKYGYDSWESMGDKTRFFSIIIDDMSFTKSVNILSVNSKYGEDFLAVKNTLKKKGISEVSVDSFSTDERFIWDLESVSENAYLGDSIKDLRKHIYKKYDIILLCEEVAKYVEIKDFVEIISEYLSEEGKLFVVIDNFYSKDNIERIFRKAPLSDEYEQSFMGRKSFISIDDFVNTAKKNQLNLVNIVKILNNKQNKEIDKIYKKLSSELKVSNDITDMDVLYYIVELSKNI